MRIALLLLLAAYPVLADGPASPVPAVVPVRHSAAKGQSVVFTVPASAKVTVLSGRAAVVEISGTTGVFRSDEAGDHVIAAFTADGVTSVVITVAGVPKPPGPVDPPVIPPVDPPVVNPLTAAFQKLYKEDTAAGKGESLKDLIELYRQAQTLCRDESLKTMKSLMVKVKDASDVLMQAGELEAVRKAIQSEMKTAFPFDGALDKTTRERAEAKFKTIHDALKGVTP